MEDEMGDLFGADEHRDGILRRISPKLCSIADFIVARCCTRYGRSPFHIFYNSDLADGKNAFRGESLIAGWRSLFVAKSEEPGNANWR